MAQNIRKAVAAGKRWQEKRDAKAAELAPPRDNRFFAALVEGLRKAAQQVADLMAAWSRSEEGRKFLQAVRRDGAE